MSIPTTKAEFAEYCLRKLGKPVIEINVDATQIDDRIDEAVQLFQMFHMDAVERVFLGHVVTEDDVANGYLTLDAPVISVTKIVFSGSGFGSANFATNVWQFQYDAFYEMGFTSTGGASTSMSDYIMRMSHLKMVEGIIASYPTIHHSMHGNKIYIDDDWSKLPVGASVVYEAYIALDPSVYTSIWSDIWLTSYTVALIGRQWGENLSKFQEVQLPGGITLNGDAIYEKFDARLKELMEDLDTRWSYPPDFFVG